MSSHGERSADEHRVELLCYLVDKGGDGPESTTFFSYREPLALQDRTGKTRNVCRLYRFYRFYRRPRGMWGGWVILCYLGKDRAPDLSTPIALHTLPRGALPLTDEECADYWFRENAG